MTTIAFFLVISSAVFHAFWNFAIKKTTGDIATLWNGLVATCCLLTPLLLFLDLRQIQLIKIYPYIITSGIIHTFYFLLLTKIYEHGEISLVYPIARGSGIAGTTLLAFFLLQEKISFFGIMGILTIVTGILLIGLKIRLKIGKVKVKQFSSITFLALMVGLMISSYSIIDKLAVGVSHPLFYIYACTLAYTIILSPYLLTKKREQIVAAWKYKKKYSLIIGLGSVSTYLIILFVYQIAPVSYVVATRELSISIGAILGFLLLKEKPTARKIIGIMVILIGVLLIKMIPYEN